MAAAGINLFSSKLQEFLLKLHERFDDRRRDLLSQRTLKTLRLRNGEKLDFLEETKHVRAAQWRVANVPSDLLNRRIEITGPAEPKMIINALNSGANVFMADLEDSLSPTWDNLMIGQQALYQAVRKNLSFTNDQCDGKCSSSQSDPRPIRAESRTCRSKLSVKLSLA